MADRDLRRLPLGAAVVVAVGVVFALWVAIKPGGDTLALWFDDVVTVLAAAAAVRLTFRTSLRCEGRLRTFWRLMACATGAWMLAEVLWSVYDLVLQQDVPSPSWADIGYLGAIPLALAALVAHPAMAAGSRVHKARQLFEGLVVATALLFLSWTLVLGPLARATHVDAAGLVTLAYPFGDVVLVFFAVLALREVHGPGRRALWVLLGALAVLAVTDSAYSYLTGVAGYASGDLLDVGWVVGYLGIALAAWTSERATVEAHVHAGPASLPIVSLVAPLAPVFLALVVATYKIQTGHHLDVLSWVCLIGLIAVVLLRQAFMVLEMFGVGQRGSLEQRMTRATLGPEARA
jgi:diguanylate cyclase